VSLLVLDHIHDMPLQSAIDPAPNDVIKAMRWTNIRDAFEMPI
jgi:hypothetical protein